ncbi:transmembrane 4 L6 family member 4-like, partial [Notothenia coriiceps]|uniref:Transmembrane 4 L6 family member 4-like n=1 Tax=Notothenia coriiceps TaxID=8208 RepID=A0A6I9MLK3_9TELE
MCTGKCSRCVAVTLYPLAFISIICNIVLFFPGGDVKYAQDGHITEEVKYMGGLIGGGIMVLLPALYIHLTGTQGCCGNRCGVSLKTLFQEFSEKRVTNAGCFSILSKAAAEPLFQAYYVIEC